MTFTAQQKREAVERELGYRRRVYKRQVENGKMKQAQLDFQIAIFEAIAADYTEAAAKERLI